VEMQTDEFWQDINLPILENVRRRLRQLVKLIEPKERTIVYTDFEDEIGTAVDVVLPNIGAGTDKARFLMKVRHFLTQHENHITIQKLRRNEQLTPQDLSELERMFLAESVGSPEDLERIRGEGGLGLFVRSLVGLDREAAKQALAGFVSGRMLSANQIEFRLSDRSRRHGPPTALREPLHRFGRSGGKRRFCPRRRSGNRAEAARYSTTDRSLTG
jgi:type I restriction enzyme R subunit